MNNNVDPYPLSYLTAEPAADGLHRLEMAVQRAGEGLTRWQAGCLEQVSGVSLAGAEITLLLLIGSGRRPKSIKELARATNRVDIPNIQYSLRKLASAGLTRKQGAGRSGVTYSLTEEGCHLAGKLNALRERLLTQAIEGHSELAGRLRGAADVLEELVELYGAAAQQTEAPSKD
ncbi:winged helix DNA-binding protein [Leisingera aquaemixtae]|uniref:winged helix DNA-binding protein n=1 Tax=Leisingera aquaemixtae TaxID=1396826 RepID=UPI0021A6CE1C|nr:winged helix DNA-binding protein [Leisingera aquaemixtae]